MAEQYDTKSNVKLGRFQPKLEASHVSSHSEELWYNETVSVWMTILYIYICVYVCVCVYLTSLWDAAEPFLWQIFSKSLAICP